jgi:hypothetical protein
LSEQQMVTAVQAALAEHGVDDEIVVAGQFYPRGHTGGMFAGGIVGADAGDLLGGVAGGIGLGAGSLAGARAADAAAGLPAKMLIGVSSTKVYGFAAGNRRDTPTQLLFEAERAGLTVKVSQRVNVRILELIHTASGSRIALEGNRLPVTHSGDVISALRG